MAIFSIHEAYARNWWVLLIRGLLSVLIGILAFTRPALTLLALVMLYGFYALADGLTALWAGGSTRSWGLVLAGIFSVLAGIYTFFYPGITAALLFYLIVAWAIVRGIFEIVAGIQMRKEISNEWMLIGGGLLSIIFGIMLFANQAAGVLALVWVIGLYALIFGLMMIVQAFRLRGLSGRLERLA